MIKIWKWIDSNELILNYKKCSFIVIGARNPSDFNVRIKNQQINQLNEMKILGVILDNKLNFHHTLK
jgi:hypothetical protein